MPGPKAPGLGEFECTPVLVYAAGNNDWVRYSPSMITTGMHDNVDQKSMYIRHSNSHFDVVLSIR